MEEEKKTIETSQAENQNEEEEKTTEYTKPRLDLFRDVIADEHEQELFKRKYPKKSKTAKQVQNAKVAKLGQAFKNLLGSTYCELEDGTTLSVAERLAMLTTAYTLANPTPKNVKTLQEITGEAEVNVNVNGSVGIDKFFEDCKPTNKDDEGDD